MRIESTTLAQSGSDIRIPLDSWVAVSYPPCGGKIRRVLTLPRSPIMPTIIESRIQDRISSFVKELDVLVRRSALEAVSGVLDGAPVRRGPGRPRGSSRASTLVEGVAPAIVAHVRANGGQTVGEIAGAVGAAPDAAKKAIKGLLDSGQLAKTGKKRGTRYHIGSGRIGSGRAVASKAKHAKRRGKAKRA